MPSDDSTRQRPAGPDGTPAGPRGTAQWEEDFPIDWPDDHFVARREFTKFMVASSLGLFLGTGYLVARAALDPGAPVPGPKPIARVADVPVGQAHLFTYPGPADRCILIHLEPGRFVAYNQKCTHLSCAVMYRSDPGDLFCPCHEGYFDPASGKPTAGPPTRPLHRIELRIDGDTVFATGVKV